MLQKAFVKWYKSPNIMITKWNITWGVFSVSLKAISTFRICSSVTFFLQKVDILSETPTSTNVLSNSSQNISKQSNKKKKSHTTQIKTGKLFFKISDFFKLKKMLTINKTSFNSSLFFVLNWMNFCLTSFEVLLSNDWLIKYWVSQFSIDQLN